MRPHPTRRLLAPLVALAILAGACSDDDDSTADSEPVSTTAADQVASTAETSAPAETSASDGTAEPSEATAATSAAPSDVEYDREATLRMAWTVPAVPLDPHTANTTVGQFPYVMPVYDRLTNIVRGPALEPMLATEWVVSEDGLATDFTLREDALFHDGTPVDAEAVKMSLDRAINLPESTVARFLQMIEEITVVDPLTVRITTNRPAADLPYVLATSVGSIINPAALENPDLDVKPAGSGPYQLAEITLGDRAVYERAPNYWNPEAQKVARIELLGITDDNARINALRSGQVDAMLSKVGLYDQVSDLGEGFEFFSYPATATYALYLNHTRPNIDNVLIRRALNFAIDREALNETILKDQCPPLSQALTDTYDPGYLPELDDLYTYDPDQARSLLTEAGVGDGFSMNLIVGAGLSPQDLLAPAIQAMLADVDISLEIIPWDSATTTGEWAAGNYDSHMQTRTGSPTAAEFLSRSYTIPPGWIGEAVPEFAAAVTMAFDPTISDAELETSLTTANRIASEEAFDVFICAVPTQFAYTDKVIGMDSMGQADFQGIFDLRYVGVAAS